MAAVFVSLILWGIVFFMARDDYCKAHEKNALSFLVVIAVVLSALGIWSFETDHISQIPLDDWILIGLFPISLFYLKIRTGLIKKQSNFQGRDLSLMELEPDEIQDKVLVNRFRKLRLLMWGYAALALIVRFWSNI